MPKGSRRGRLILIDAHSLIYRAFFALPPMSTTHGQVTNAAYGFTSMLSLVFGARPEYAIAAFDVGRPAFRTELYPEYKAGRRATPEDLRPQFDLCRGVLAALTIPVRQVEGFEADDVIGTLSRQAEEQGLQVTIVSGDLDCLQLVSERTEALVPRRGITDTMTYGPEQVRQRYGLEPAQMIDFKALRGDASDNIPGVPGVGDKTATQLLIQYGSVDRLLEHLDDLKEGRVKRSLTEHQDDVRTGKQLVTIRRDVPVTLDLEAARWLRYDPEEARRVFDELEFRQLLSRLPPPDVAPLQPTLEFEPQAPAHDVRLAEAGETGELRRAVAGADEVSLFGLWDGAPREGALAGVGLALPGPDEGAASEVWYAPAALLPELVGALEQRPLATHDPKELQVALERQAGPLRLDWNFSTALAAYLLGAGARDPRLEDLAQEFLGQQLTSQADTFGSGRKARAVVDAEPGEAADYAGARAAAVLDLQPRLVAEMRNLAVDHLFYEVELPLASVLYDMERHGVAIDVPYLRKMQEELGGQLAALEAEITEVAGHPFNMNAPQQLAKVLFEELALPVGKRTKTGYSTDADTLESLREKHPIVGLILEHRQLSKLKSTYVDALPQLVDPMTGRVHTSFGQAST
ncbi:MAG: DNA polymerase, partial [Candidatus Dormibacteraceae bacterium]